MALPSFAVSGNLKEILGDVISSELVESALSQAVITFRPNVPLDQLVTWGTTMFRVLPVVGMVDTEGNIVLDADNEVRLLAQDDGLSIRDLQWQVVIAIPSQVIPPSPSGMIKSWWIDAEADGAIVDLRTTLPVISTPFRIITQGPPGAPVDGVELDIFGRVVFTVNGIPIDDPLVLTIIDLTSIEGGDAFGTGIIVVDGGEA